MAEEENEKNDFYNAVQSLSSITDEKTRTLLAEILVKKEMKKKSGMYYLSILIQGLSY